MKKEWVYPVKIILFFAVSGAVYLAFRFLLPLLLPFAFALTIVLILNPIISRIRSRVKIPNVLLGISLLILSFALLLFAGWGFIHLLVKQARLLFENSYVLTDLCYDLITSCCCFIEDKFGIHYQVSYPFIIKNLQSSLLNARQSFFSGLIGNSCQYLKVFFGFFGSLMFTFVSFLLILKDYPAIKQSLNQFPLFCHMQKLWRKIYSVGITYLKAQLLILLIISTLCSVGLFLFQNPYSLFLGILIGLLDSLPGLGTGCVLVPVSVYYFATGNFLLAACYFTLYVLTSFSRELLEPKLIGSKLGIPSIFILLSIYVGLHLFGVPGILLGPVYFLVTYEILMEIYDSEFFQGELK